MERKKLIIIACILIVLMIGLMLLEASRHGNHMILEGVSQAIADWKIARDYEHSDEYKEEKKLEGVVHEVEELLKSSNINTLYELTNPIYLEYKFENDKKLFTEYMSKYIGENIELDFQSYQKKGNMYACTLISRSEGKSSTLYVLIIPENEEETKYTLIFENLNKLSKETLEVSSNELGIKSRIKFVATASKTLILVVENENISNSEINYQYDSVSLLDTSSHSYELSTIKGQRITIRPGEKTRETYRFMNNNIFQYPKNSLKITFSDTDGKSVGSLIYNMSSLGI